MRLIDHAGDMFDLYDEARRAPVEVRRLTMTLPAPDRGPWRERAPLELALMQVRKCSAPAGAR